MLIYHLPAEFFSVVPETWCRESPPTCTAHLQLPSGGTMLCSGHPALLTASSRKGLTLCLASMSIFANYEQPYVILQTELTHSTGLKWTQVSTKDVTRCSPAHGHKKPSKWTTREIPHMAATRSTLCSCILKVNCTLLRN